jgi:hypothetical protein
LEGFEGFVGPLVEVDVYSHTIQYISSSHTFLNICAPENRTERNVNMSDQKIQINTKRDCYVMDHQY